MEVNATPSAKKRKFNNASSVLARPFKSPFRSQRDVELSDCTESTSAEATEGSVYTPSHAGETSASSTSGATLPSPTTPPPNAPPTKEKEPTSSVSSTDPQARILSYQKEQHRLQSRLSRQRDELNTINQAVKILEQHKVAELEILIRKWRGVSREAAEELFVGAKDKVNRMGGVRVYKEKLKKGKMKQQEWGGWDDNQVADEEGEGGSDAEREKEMRKAEMEEMMSFQEKENRDEAEAEAESDGDDETFTIDMMLKGLNVDLNTIGFDKVCQKWFD